MEAHMLGGSACLCNARWENFQQRITIIWRHGSASIIIRNDLDCDPCPHANVLGRLVPNSLPTGEKVEIKPWIGLTNGV